MMAHRWPPVFVVAMAAVGLISALSWCAAIGNRWTAAAAEPGPPSLHETAAAPRAATLHYAADSNFDSGGRYVPIDAGFNLADVSSVQQLSALPPGTKALVWMGMCDGADAAFKARVASFAGADTLFGFYLMDDPDPTGRWQKRCLADNLKAEADWIHAHAPGARSFLALMNMGTSTQPSFLDTYTPQNTHVDLFGIAAYPCRVEPQPCDLDMIDRFVSAALQAGIPRVSLVPIVQTFGAGDWKVDGDGRYAMPDAAALAAILDRWDMLVPAPAFDYAYSWSPQHNDRSLTNEPDLQAVFRKRHGLAPHSAAGITSTLALAP